MTFFKLPTHSFSAAKNKNKKNPYLYNRFIFKSTQTKKLTLKEQEQGNVNWKRYLCQLLQW